MNVLSAGSLFRSGEETPLVRLTTGKANFDLEFAQGTSAILEKVFACLLPVFRPRETGEAHYRIVVRPFSDMPDDFAEQATRPFALRRSSALPFNLDLTVGMDSDGNRIGFDPASGTACKANSASSVLTLYVSESSHFHLIETFRYTALAVEQSLGSVILHASACLQGDAAVLVLGDKGQGKTTTLLTLLETNGLDYFSGDKVLLDEKDGEVRLRAWPDYPHIGLGTLRMFPRLASACGISFRRNGEALPDSHKVLVEPAVFRRALGANSRTVVHRCRLLVFPDVRQDEISFAKIETAADRIEALSSAIEDARIFTPGQWHGLIETPPARDVFWAVQLLAEAAWWKAAGKGADFGDLLAEDSR